MLKLNDGSNPYCIGNLIEVYYDTAREKRS